MSAETLGFNQNPFNEKTIDNAYFGAWVPAKLESLSEALMPHVHDVRGVPSIPIRLVNLMNNASNNPTTK